MSNSASITRSLLSDRRFLVACGVMLVAAISWQVAVKGMRVALRKAPVPWPVGVVVNEESRNTSFPKKIGPYVLVEEDGELMHDKQGKPIKDGKPDGEIILSAADLNALPMGKGEDKNRIATRQSNWYIWRIYRDTRQRDERYRYWRLCITYFTGGLDNVPHIGENCLVAGGANMIELSSKAVAVTGTQAPWDGELNFRRLVYDFKSPDGMGSSDEYVLYYIFSMNGQPEEDNKVVRAKLMNPFSRYVYFAKIEVGPSQPAVDVAESDRRTEEFIRTCLPVVLKTLPMPSDVQKLESAQ